MSGDRLESPPVTGEGNGVVSHDKKTASVMVPSQRLRLHPNKDHMPESYEDLQLDFSPSVFRSLEKYLPPNMLSDSREDKVKFMRDILLKYLPHGERTRVMFELTQLRIKESETALLGFCFLFISIFNFQFSNGHMALENDDNALRLRRKKLLSAIILGMLKWLCSAYDFYQILENFKILLVTGTKENLLEFLGDWDEFLRISFTPRLGRVPLFWGIDAQKHREYRQKIISHYKPLKRELYSMHPVTFFVPSFMKAINDNTEESLRSIISEPSPGVLTFEMLQPRFCELLVAEVENFEAWVNDTKFRIMRPNTMNKYGAVLDDFGLETMLDKLMNGFIRPISKGDTYVLIPDKLHHMFPGIFFREVGGANLDSHHGFVVEYGKDWDVDLGFHVDDSEVTLNVCLGKQFSGGELFFRGTRCDKHVNTGSKPEEIFDYSHVPGRAVLHLGRHRHGVRATTSGHRINLLLWCRRYFFFLHVKLISHDIIRSSERSGNIKKISRVGVESAYKKRSEGSEHSSLPLNRSYSGRMVSP
ncbi:hypothetical protein POTOM_041876 [Populus tomentosa]|uniref:Fe2OG dioxygenase domain-containing protein n=1 Tax=Populus tomentosa TaxID=118781 RepID=A0A8X8CGH3_POPTO|nr:hypothetical protein POTOM_041876 [Populus tomentosa]